MKNNKIYQVKTLDSRYRYCRWFDYCVEYPKNMAVNSGPLLFDLGIQWCVNTWGHSAEIRTWEQVYEWYTKETVMSKFAKNVPKDMPNSCNRLWSWSNHDQLRIYFKSDAELMFFNLKNQNISAD